MKFKNSATCKGIGYQLPDLFWYFISRRLTVLYYLTSVWHYYSSGNWIRGTGASFPYHTWSWKWVKFYYRLWKHSTGEWEKKLQTARVSFWSWVKSGYRLSNYRNDDAGKKTLKKWNFSKQILCAEFSCKQRFSIVRPCWDIRILV